MGTTNGGRPQRFGPRPGRARSREEEEGRGGSEAGDRRRGDRDSSWTWGKRLATVHGDDTVELSIGGLRWREGEEAEKKREEDGGAREEEEGGGG